MLVIWITAFAYAVVHVCYITYAASLYNLQSTSDLTNEYRTCTRYNYKLERKLTCPASIRANMAQLVLTA
jgi:hypothetical protein